MRAGYPGDALALRRSLLPDSRTPKLGRSPEIGTSSLGAARRSLATPPAALTVFRPPACQAVARRPCTARTTYQQAFRPSLSADVRHLDFRLLGSLSRAQFGIAV